jgi:hypothetical protein
MPCVNGTSIGDDTTWYNESIAKAVRDKATPELAMEFWNRAVVQRDRKYIEKFFSSLDDRQDIED